MFGLRSPASLALLQEGAAPLVALALVAAATPASTDPVPAEAAIEAGAEDEASAASLEAAAITVAHELRAVPADPSDRLCARTDLRVSWSEPRGYTHGAHLAPVGPRPEASTASLNGVVVCGDSAWAYMGFEAERDGDAWVVTAVPYGEEGHGNPGELNLDADPLALADLGDDADADVDVDAPDGARPSGATAGADPVEVAAPASSRPARPVSSSGWLAGLGPIEPYARHEPQTTCSPTPKAGTVVLRDALLAAHPQTRNLGIARACHIGGRSEHKEGRAFDWGAYVHRPTEKASAERFLHQLMATDAHGNRHALARRMGVMYVIWNGRIWSASHAGEGWRRYYGPNPHTDHVHISLNAAGAHGRTSFFTLGLAAAGVLGSVPPGASLPTSGTPTAPAPSRDTSGTAPAPAPKPAPAPAPQPAPEPAPKPAPAPAPAPAPKPAPKPAPTPKRDEDAERKAEEQRQREAEAEQRRLAEEQRAAEKEQRRAEREQAKVADDPDATDQEERSSKGGGKGGGKGKKG